MTPITSKEEMYRRLNAGRLGPTLASAETKEAAAEFIRKGPGPFGLRFKQSGAKTLYNLSAEEAWWRVLELQDGSYNLSGMVVDSQRLCYGHLLDGVGGWFLHYSDTPKPCKLVPSVDGCVEKHKKGLDARLYLRGIMDDVGWDWLQFLVAEYPDHVVEFSVFTSSLSCFGPSNTVFWEVRCTTGEYERSSGWQVK